MPDGDGKMRGWFDARRRGWRLAHIRRCLSELSVATLSQDELEELGRMLAGFHPTGERGPGYGWPCGHCARRHPHTWRRCPYRPEKREPPVGCLQCGSLLHGTCAVRPVVGGTGTFQSSGMEGHMREGPKPMTVHELVRILAPYRNEVPVVVNVAPPGRHQVWRAVEVRQEPVRPSEATMVVLEPVGDPLEVCERCGQVKR